MPASVAAKSDWSKTSGYLLSSADQVNLTDAESRIMPVPGGGFEQCYNAQACVAAGCLLVVANNVVQAANDKQQVEPMLGQLAALPAALGQVETLLADTGYFSEANVQACVADRKSTRLNSSHVEISYAVFCLKKKKKKKKIKKRVNKQKR